MVEPWKKDRGESANQKWLEIRRRYELLAAHLDERRRRHWLGAEALAYGRGLSVVSEACSVSHRTVQAGMREVQKAPSAPARSARIRRPGGGSKPITEKFPRLKEELEKLLDPWTRGDPQSPLRWTSKSLRRLAAELTERGFAIDMRRPRHSPAAPSASRSTRSSPSTSSAAWPPPTRCTPPPATTSGPIRLNTSKQSVACVPTEVVGVSVAP